MNSSIFTFGSLFIELQDYFLIEVMLSNWSRGKTFRATSYVNAGLDDCLPLPEYQDDKYVPADLGLVASLKLLLTRASKPFLTSISQL